jgi:ubiquinone/menaquinone biosynthesis C-methylase UbiE
MGNEEFSNNRKPKLRTSTTLLRVLKTIRGMLSEYLDISHRINYRNFGYIPRGSIRDILGKLFGHVNFLKRLQARDVMVMLDIQGPDIILDFGCGSGYFTVEMAKEAHQTYGFDVTPYLRTIGIPPPLAGKLGFVMGRGENLPFQDNRFDKILASEILPMTNDPRAFLSEMRRVIRRGGRLVICNGAGHPSIKKAYERGHWFLKILSGIYKEKVPASYESYCSILQKSFGTCQTAFLEKEDIASLLEETGFSLETIAYSPSSFIGATLSWSQFLLWIRKRRTLSQKYFHFVYPVASIINSLGRARYEGGLICSARKN